MINQILNLTKLLISHSSTASNPQALKNVLEEAIKPLKESKNLNFEYFEKGKKILEQKIRKIIGRLGKIEILLFEPPQITFEKNPYVLSLKKSIEKIIGKKPKIIVKHGGSDIRHFNQVGCDGVTFGPIGGNLHADEEWVDIKSLENYYHILKTFLLAI